MPFSPDLAESYSRLSSLIPRFLDARQHQLRLHDDDATDYPLLILETGQDIAGFAIVCDSPRTAYAAAYESFRVLYGREHEAWEAQNLSFVICRFDDDPSDDGFFSQVETDIYFCRKYVIKLPADDGDLANELQRLPFLPLQADRSHDSVVPPSARRLLRSLGLSADLSEQLVTARKRSATRIVDDILGGDTPLPLEVQTSHQVEPDILSQDDISPIRVTRISIEGFRAYRTRQEFDLDADVVVLYGPNGLGKTSFFDALDYACTGSIGRFFRNRQVTSERLGVLARHLGSPPENCSVTVDVKTQGSVSTIERRLLSWNKAQVDGRDNTRASVLKLLTSADLGQRKAYVSTLERLFRATHLFSQSTPELLVEFEHDSVIPFELVSRMFALGDYATALKKAEEIRSLLARKATKAEKECDEAKADLDGLRDQIENMPRPTEKAKAGNQITAEAEKVSAQLRETLAFNVEETEITASLAREWRALVMAAVEDERELLRQGTALGDRHETVQQLRETSSTLQGVHKRFQEELEKKESALKHLKEERETALRAIAEDRSALIQSETRHKALSEFLALEEPYAQAVQALQSWKIALARDVDEAKAVKKELLELTTAVDTVNLRLVAQRTDVEKADSLLRQLTEIEQGTAAWLENKRDEKALRMLSNTIESRIREIGGEAQRLDSLVSDRRRELAICEREYEEATANQAKLTRLLDDLEQFVSSTDCPACGATYGSTSDLLERIHSRKADRPASVLDLAARRLHLNQSLSDCTAKLASLTEQQEAAVRDHKEAGEKAAEIRASIASFEEAATTAGLPVGEELETSLATRLTECKEVLEARRASLREAESDLANLSQQVDERTRRDRELASRRKQLEATGPSLDKEVADLRARIDVTGIDSGANRANLLEEKRLLESSISVARRQIEELVRTEEILSRRVAVSDGEVKNAREKALDRHEEIQRLKLEIEDFERRAREYLGGQRVISHDAFRARECSIEERLAHLQEIARRCLTLERWLDAHQLSTLLADLESQEKAASQRKQALDELASQLWRATKTFAQIGEALEKQSSRSVSSYVAALGPLTTLVQKRLRAVYGFGDVTLRAQDGRIRVAVGWQQDTVSPADYFSDSQKQILMLSLFLAGRLTQTWSGFAPILMDDPVTHFDDLNAFGLVELIRGLSSQRPGQRQYFISTCDERLFALMRSKFRELQGRALFYRFEGISRQGPAVRTLSNVS